jgi:hypothetical protein
VERSCKLGNEPSGSIKCWELPSGCTSCGLSSGTRLHRVSYLVSYCNLQFSNTEPMSYPTTTEFLKLKLKLFCDRWSVGQTVSVSGTNLGFHLVGRPLWREDCYTCYWTMPTLSLSDPRPTVLDTLSYCLTSESVSLLSPTTRRATVEVF